VKAVVCIPDDAPKMKVAGMKSYGADIRVFDRHKDDRDAFGREIAERERLIPVPAYDDYLIMAGQGTAGLEFVEEVPDLDSLLTPCSGGGLFAGVSSAAKFLKPSIRCFAVEPDTANDTQQSVAKGERVKIPPPPTIADGLRVQKPGELTFPITRQNAEAILTVTDEEIIATMKFFLFRLKLLVEPSGAAAAAAVFARKIPADCRRVGVVLSGGNVDSDVLSEMLRDQE
jgi:threonine dehydratase